MSDDSRDVGPGGGARDRGVGGVGKTGRLLDDLLDRPVEVEPETGLVGLQRLEGGELGVDQRGGHEVARAAGHAGGDDLAGRRAGGGR